MRKRYAERTGREPAGQLALRPPAGTTTGAVALRSRAPAAISARHRAGCGLPPQLHCISGAHRPEPATRQAQDAPAGARRYMGHPGIRPIYGRSE